MTLTDFFFNIPIYTPITIEGNDPVFLQIIDCTKAKDFVGYNPFEKMESTFSVVTDLIPDTRGTTYTDTGGFETVRIRCKRTDREFFYYIFWQPSIKKLTKVGQYPSVADFHISEVKQYSKLLSTEKLKEFTRAIGLAANGVGIGSFVYLRRIFEHLISEAFDKAKLEGTVSEHDFQRARMDEKIDLLHAYLPTFLTENKTMYSVLSVGIHELDEQTCLNHFDTLRVGIEIILDEKLDEFRKKEKIELAKQKLAALKGEVKK